MVRSISTKIYKTYCFTCKEMTQTLNIKRFRYRGKFLFKGNCEECKRLKVDRGDLGYWE